MDSNFLRMEKNTGGAVAQDGEENLLLLADVAEKYGNDEHRHEVLEQTEERQSGLNLPQKNFMNSTFVSKEENTGGAVAQNGEENLWLLADVAEKCINDGRWSMALVYWGRKKKRSGVTRPRKRALRKEFDKAIRTLKEKGVEMEMVIEKTLTASDLSDQNSRLSLPEGKIMTKLLSDEEREKMEKRTQDGGRCQGMEISLIEPSLEVHNIVLSRWKIGKGFSYVLCSTWNEVKKGNGLESGDIVQIWSFKLDGNLGVVLYTPAK